MRRQQWTYSTHSVRVLRSALDSLLRERFAEGFVSAWSESSHVFIREIPLTCAGAVLCCACCCLLYGCIV